MRPKLKRFLFLCVVLFSIDLASAVERPQPTIDFAHQIVPILREHCVECHGGEKAKGGFSINTRRLFLEDDAATPGDAADSWFLELVGSDDPEEQMPPKKQPRVSAEQIQLLRDWVDTGLSWESGFTFTDNHYEPPLKPRRVKLPPDTHNPPHDTHPIDRLINAYLLENKLPQPHPIADSTFLRRAHLDIVGLLPTPQTVNAFNSNSLPNQRAVLIDQLLADDIAYTEHWLTFFNDLLRNDYGGTGFITGGRRQISDWLYRALLHNKPYDQMVRELIAPPDDASRGFIDGITWRGEVSAGQTVPIQFAQSVAQSFLGINMKCASCHDSFIDRWTLDEAYSLAAIYADASLPISRCDILTGRVASPAWPFPEIGQVDPGAPRPQRLQQLAGLMTHPENGRLARNIVNRVWHRLMGRGIVHPLDAMQSEPWDTDLLDYLAADFQDNGYDLKELVRFITTSRAYQSRSEAVVAESSSTYAYAGPRARRMSAEQFTDALWQIADAAPERYDAPVVRGKIDPKVVGQTKLSAQWIWGVDPTHPIPVANQRLAFYKTFQLDQPVLHAGAVITADNEYTLYINNKQIAKDGDWTSVESLRLQDAFKRGKNTLLIVAKNGGLEPNAAGLFFEAHIRLKDGGLLAVLSDDTWQASRKIPAAASIKSGDWGELNWEPIALVKDVRVWAEATRQAPRKMVMAMLTSDRPVRASLLKSDFLMRSLGRPNRDQIVSTRPNELTTLEAIDLANNEQLTQSLLQSGRRLAAEAHDDLPGHLYALTLVRAPTSAERDALNQVLGQQPTAESIADTLWAICMTPEFLLVR